MHRLLSYLLNYFLFAGTMFFAAGAVADVAGGGDGGAIADGGNVSDTGGESDSGLAEDGQDSAGQDSSGEGTQDGADDSVQAQGDPNALADLGDGRKVPQKYAELFKTDKFLRNLFFSEAQLKKVHPGGVREALEFHQKVEEAGGLDGIEQLQTDLAGHSADAELYSQNPGKWIENNFTENPENSISAWQHSMSLVAEKFPEQFDFAVAPFIVETLDQNGAIHSAYTKLAASADPNDKAIAAKLAELYNGLKTVAKNAPKKPQASENKEAKELQTQREQVRNERINVKAAPYRDKAVDSGLDKAAQKNGFDLAKLRKEQPARYAKLTKDVRDTMESAIRADDPWLGRYSSALASNNVEKSIRMLNARHDAALNGNGNEPGIAEKVFTEWFGTGKPKVNPNPGNKNGARTAPAGNGKSVLHVTAMPSPKEIDYSDARTKIIDQTAVLKNGKIVSWAS